MSNPIRSRSVRAVRSRRVSIAAGVLSVALAVPTVVAVPGSPFAALAVAQTTADAFKERYTTANFWNTKEAVVEGLQLDAGDKVEATTNTIFNWKFRNDNGQLVLIRPQSPTGYKTGDVGIPVKVTPAGGTAFNTTLKVEIVDVNPANAPVQQALEQRYEVDFGGKSGTQPVQGLQLPPGVELSKGGVTLPTGWVVGMSGNEVIVTSGLGAKDGNLDLPVTVKGANLKDAKLLLTVKNAPTSAGNIGGFLGNVLGGMLGGSGGGLLKDLIHVENHPGGVVVEVKDIGNNAKVDVPVNVEVQPSAVVVSDNGKIESGAVNIPVEVKDNANNNKVEVTASAEIHDNIKENGKIESGGVSVPVEIKDNVRDNNANVSAPVSVPVNVEVKDNNGVAPGGITDNGKVEIQPGAMDGAIRDNNVNVNTDLQPGAIVGVQPGGISDNGKMEPGAVNVPLDAKVEVPITGNGVFLPGSSGGNGQGGAAGQAGSSLPGSSQANVQSSGGGINSPACIASMVGFGIPLLAGIPLLLASGLAVPGLEGASAQLAATFDEAARGFGITGAELTTAAGGAVGLLLVAIAAIAATTCMPTGATVEVQATPTEPANGGGNNAPAPAATA